MVRPEHARLSVVRQCALLNISRSGLYYEPKGASEFNLVLMQKIDRAFTDWPFFWCAAEEKPFDSARLWSRKKAHPASYAPDGT
jgi:hypothetical protein